MGPRTAWRPSATSSTTTAATTGGTSTACRKRTTSATRRPPASHSHLVPDPLAGPAQLRGPVVRRPGRALAGPGHGGRAAAPGPRGRSRLLRAHLPAEPSATHAAAGTGRRHRPGGRRAPRVLYLWHAARDGRVPG